MVPSANKLSQCASSGSGSVAGLTPADGIVLLDAHPAVAVNLLRGIDPSIPTSQDTDTVGLNSTNPPITRNNSLFLYNPANGFNAATNGLSTYSPAFQAQYTAAEAQRMNAWIAQAQHQQALIAQGNYRFPDDDSIIIAAAGGSVAGGGNEAAIFKPDNQVWCCTLQPEQVLTNNNTVVTKNFTTERLPNGADYPGILTFDTGSKNLTITSFLSANAIRATDALDYNQIDWCSTNDSVPCALQSIKNPILMVGMGAYYFFPDMERYYLNYSASPDKSFVIADGLVHGLTICTPSCTGGPYTNMQNNLWNYIAKWISDRFPATAAHDFNGALRSDVLWRDNSNNIGMWLMNGTTVSQSKMLGAVSAAWSVIGQRDFNGDGNADILWRDTSGNLGIWLMNGTNVVPSMCSAMCRPPGVWSAPVTSAPTTTATFFGAMTAAMSASAHERHHRLADGGPWNVPLAWSVARMDHKGDIFWSNSTTGEVGMWTMQGTQITATVDFGVMPSNCRSPASATSMAMDRPTSYGAIPAVMSESG